MSKTITRWEYYCVDWRVTEELFWVTHYNFQDIHSGTTMEHVDWPDITKLVSELGLDGWELIAASAEDHYRITTINTYYNAVGGSSRPSGQYLFKRPKGEDGN